VRAERDPLVRVIVHVPLEVPHALPDSRGPWYCAPGRRHDDVPIGNALLASYERALDARGIVVDHFGFGTWTVGSGDTADVAFEEDDHIEVVAHLHAMSVWLRPFLQRMRADLAQRETLGEIIGVADPALGEARTDITVTLPSSRASFATLRTLHHLFGNHGNGGASQYTDAMGVHVSSGVLPADAPRMRADLHHAGFASTTQPETFVTVDAPPC
jgi:hypothetical protein